eukprot:TRINITY_DN7433_c0_g1_i1.p1 TRINITY_DN7433_c0_g1~~TRINITY_DN7433_c0_g1_i1.p1  ORF type:complete len:327 (+),score=35.57 TRINITY_DN7433_c0_g1_i1:43-981(+)
MALPDDAWTLVFAFHSIAQVRLVCRRFAPLVPVVLAVRRPRNLRTRNTGEVNQDWDAGEWLRLLTVVRNLGARTVVLRGLRGVAHRVLELVATLLAEDHADSQFVASLDIGGNQLGQSIADIVQLSQSLQLPGAQGLERLDLRFNQLGPEGARLLVPALASLPHLTTLSLCCTGLAPQGAVTLAAELPRFASLTELNLQGNLIGGRGATALLRALPGTPIRLINLRHNQIGTEMRSELANVLHKSFLERIVLADNDIAEFPAGDSTNEFAKLLVGSTVRYINLGQPQAGPGPLTTAIAQLAPKRGIEIAAFE